MVTLAATLPPGTNNNSGGVGVVGGGEGIGSDGRNSGASGGSDEDSGGIRVSGETDAEFQRHERHPSTENVEPTYDDDDDDDDDMDDEDDGKTAAPQNKKPTNINIKPLVHENDSDGGSSHDGKLTIKDDDDVEKVGKHGVVDDEEENGEDDEDDDDDDDEDVHNVTSQMVLPSTQQNHQQTAITDAGNTAGLFGADFNFTGGINPALLAMQPPTSSTQSTFAAQFEALRQQIPNGSSSSFLPQMTPTSTANPTAALFQQVAARALAQLSMQQMSAGGGPNSIQQQQQQLGMLGVGSNVLLPSPTHPNPMAGLLGNNGNSFDANIAAAMAAFGFGPAATVPPISSTTMMQQQNDTMSSLLLMPPTSVFGNASTSNGNKLKLLTQSSATDAAPLASDRQLFPQNRPNGNVNSTSQQQQRASVDSPTDQNNPDEESAAGSSSANTATLLMQTSIKRSGSSTALLQYSGEIGAGGHDATSMSGSPMPNTWSFEEQFKSLYDIDTDPERKRFLDELFVFMQKKGSPINRIPIMAKQTLDLHKLYRLVIQRGGLVEVINKKQWREITKGLNLPSSITSAAFTLRTQYAKYLYPYECEKHNFSTIDELQSAIDGNKREGRRSDQVSTPSLPSSDTAVAGLGGGGEGRHHTPSLLSQQPPPPPPPPLPLSSNSNNSMAPSMAAPANSVLNDALRAAAAAATSVARSGGASSSSSSSTANNNTNSVQQHLAHLMNNNSNGNSSAINTNMDQHMNAVNQLLMMNSHQQQQQQQQLNSTQQPLSFAEQMRKSSSNSSPASDETSPADVPATSTNTSRKRAAPGASLTSSKRSSHLELLARHLVQQQQQQSTQQQQQQQDQQFNNSPAKRLCTGDPYESLKLAAALNQHHHQQQQQLQAIQAVQAAAAAAAAQAGVSQSSAIATTTTPTDPLLSHQQQQHLLLSQQAARNLLLPGLNTSNSSTTTTTTNGGLSTCNMKITPRGDSRNPLDSSLVVSMEINGILYQGVLFAHAQPQQPPPVPTLRL